VSPAGDTFREYYEIFGAETGTVGVSYSGRCDECGLRLDFEHAHEIPGVAELCTSPR
jgi:hypothetical protein